MSSRHCRIWCEPPAAHPSGCAAPAGSPLRVFIEDLSTNGTYIRTPTHQNFALRKHQRYELRSGDEISLVGRSGATSPRGPTGEAIDSAAAARWRTAAASAASSNITGMVVFMWCDLQGRSVKGMPALPAAPEDGASRASGMQPPRPRDSCVAGSSTSFRTNRVEDLYEVGYGDKESRNLSQSHTSFPAFLPCMIPLPPHPRSLSSSRWGKRWGRANAGSCTAPPSAPPGRSGPSKCSS